MRDVTLGKSLDLEGSEGTLMLAECFKELLFLREHIMTAEAVALFLLLRLAQEAFLTCGFYLLSQAEVIF